MIRLRSLLSLCLALSLALSTLGFGVARGQMPAVGEAVLCTGLGMVTIHIDAEGHPVRSVGLCPDAALSLLADPGVQPPDAPELPTHFTRASRFEPRAVMPARPALLSQGARAPPV